VLFAPQHDYDAYNAEIAKKRQSGTEPSVAEKFQKYADYFNVLMQARQRLAGGSNEDRIQRKHEKFQRHVQQIQIYNSLDQLSNGE
jgi:hypothetical protein